MPHLGVRYRKQKDLLGDAAGPVSLDEGLAKLKQMTEVHGDRGYKNGKKRKRIDQTIELCIHLGIDPRHADQLVRGALSLPQGLGKTRRVIAFCDAAMAEEAKKAGAADAGAEELVAKVEGGWSDFDVAVAHPSMMGKVGKLGRVLGPQGKMPSPKAGTVTPDVITAVKEFTVGRLEYRNDAGGNIHLPVGKASFALEALKENIEAAVKHIVRAKPAAAKGQYIRKVSLSATHTPGVMIDYAA
ncbi:MAG: 50S ribosomal protein L1 [Phycisphaerae bacterium]|nr:50S ribosomal protein L1 [Phycisphaerae bacterium]